MKKSVSSRGLVQEPVMSQVFWGEAMFHYPSRAGGLSKLFVLRLCDQFFGSGAEIEDQLFRLDE